MEYLIQCYLQQVLPGEIFCIVEELEKHCRIRVGTREHLLFSTSVHHPRDLLTERFQKQLQTSIKIRLDKRKLNHSLVQRIKRFEFYKRTKKKKKEMSFIHAYDIQRKETESNRKRAEARARNAASEPPGETLGNG